MSKIDPFNRGYVNYENHENGDQHKHAGSDADNKSWNNPAQQNDIRTLNAYARPGTEKLTINREQGPQNPAKENPLANFLSGLGSGSSLSGILGMYQQIVNMLQLNLMQKMASFLSELGNLMSGGSTSNGRAEGDRTGGRRTDGGRADGKKNNATKTDSTKTDTTKTDTTKTDTTKTDTTKTDTTKTDTTKTDTTKTDTTKTDTTKTDTTKTDTTTTDTTTTDTTKTDTASNSNSDAVKTRDDQNGNGGNGGGSSDDGNGQNNDSNQNSNNQGGGGQNSNQNSNNQTNPGDTKNDTSDTVNAVTDAEAKAKAEAEAQAALEAKVKAQAEAQAAAEAKIKADAEAKIKAEAEAQAAAEAKAKAETEAKIKAEAEAQAAAEAKAKAEAEAKIVAEAKAAANAKQSQIATLYQAYSDSDWWGKDNAVTRDEISARMKNSKYKSELPTLQYLYDNFDTIKSPDATVITEDNLLSNIDALLIAQSTDRATAKVSQTASLQTQIGYINQTKDKVSNLWDKNANVTRQAIGRKMMTLDPTSAEWASLAYAYDNFDALKSSGATTLSKDDLFKANDALISAQSEKRIADAKQAAQTVSEQTQIGYITQVKDKVSNLWDKNNTVTRQAIGRKMMTLDPSSAEWTSLAYVYDNFDTLKSPGATALSKNDLIKASDGLSNAQLEKRIADAKQSSQTASEQTRIGYINQVKDKVSKLWDKNDAVTKDSIGAKLAALDPKSSDWTALAYVYNNFDTLKSPGATTLSKNDLIGANDALISAQSEKRIADAKQSTKAVSEQTQIAYVIQVKDQVSSLWDKNNTVTRQAIGRKMMTLDPSSAEWASLAYVYDNFDTLKAPGATTLSKNDLFGKIDTLIATQSEKRIADAKKSGQTETEQTQINQLNSVRTITEAWGSDGKATKQEIARKMATVKESSSDWKALAYLYDNFDTIKAADATLVQKADLDENIRALTKIQAERLAPGYATMTTDQKITSLQKTKALDANWWGSDNSITKDKLLDKMGAINNSSSTEWQAMAYVYNHFDTLSGDGETLTIGNVETGVEELIPTQSVERIAANAKTVVSADKQINLLAAVRGLGDDWWGADSSVTKPEIAKKMASLNDQTSAQWKALAYAYDNFAALSGSSDTLTKDLLTSKIEVLIPQASLDRIKAGGSANESQKLNYLYTVESMKTGLWGSNSLATKDDIAKALASVDDMSSTEAKALAYVYDNFDAFEADINNVKDQKLSKDDLLLKIDETANVQSVKRGKTAKEPTADQKLTYLSQVQVSTYTDWWGSDKSMTKQEIGRKLGGLTVDSAEWKAWTYMYDNFDTLRGDKDQLTIDKLFSQIDTVMSDTSLTQARQQLIKNATVSNKVDYVNTVLTMKTDFWGSDDLVTREEVGRRWALARVNSGTSSEEAKALAYIYDNFTAAETANGGNPDHLLGKTDLQKFMADLKTKA